MINLVYSTQHWVVPTIIGVVLVVLLAAVIITEGLARKKKGEPFFAKPKAFFIEGYDKLKFWGTLALFVGYIFFLQILGFTVTSLIFVFLFNVLYTGVKPKALLTSAIITVVAVLAISILFGVIFNITLPSGICSITFANWGFTIY